MKITDGYILIFQSSTNKLLRFFLKEKFGHIIVAQPTGKKSEWIIFDPNQIKLGFHIISEEDVANIWGDNPSIYIRTGSQTNKLGSIQFGTCVNMVKYICGLNMRCLTPWSLYKKLAKIKRLVKPVFNLHEIKVIK